MRVQKVRFETGENMQIQLTLPDIEVVQIANAFENLPHTHDGHYQLTIPTHGTCYFTHENKQMTLVPGEALLLHADDRHCFHIGDDAGVIVAITEGGRFDASLPEVRGRDETALRLQVEPGLVKARFRRWLDLSMPSGELLAEQQSETLILNELLELMQGGGEKGLLSDKEQSPQLSDKHITQAVEYIRAHYTEAIRIDDAAAIALQSRFHFIRSFKAATGYAPYQYVLHLRMEEARRLLKGTAHTVMEISFMLGFSTPSQFYRVFEKSTGATPEQYRLRQ
jgi:AraC family transcriptional regulator